MRPLNFRVSMGNQGARFAPSEVEPPEHPLALANPQGEAEVLLDPSAQRLPIPQRPCQAHLARGAAKHGVNLLPLLCTQTPGPPASIFLHQPGQTSFLEAMHPILHRAPCIAQQSRHLRTRHSLGYQEDPVESMIITRLFRTTDLILKPQDNTFRIGNLQWSHVFMKPHLFSMRSYLCRRVLVAG